MRRHEFDPLSMVFGAIFAAVGLVFLFGNVDISRVPPAWSWPIPLMIVGAMIILLSIPFALIGSVWLMWLLDYRLSTAVWVGIIALVGLAAQTGVVMVVYCDSAYHKRKRQGLIRDLDDIVEATLEGSVQRVRPKLMTVATMMIGLVPLLWSQGAGADVMKRVAAPMVGGLFTSAFLTLEIIPVVYTYWRYAQLERERRRAAGAGIER